MRQVAICLILVFPTILWLFTVRPAWALECQQEMLFYDNWEAEEIYAKADRFADKTHLAWGTKACPIDTNKRWLTTWVQVRLEDGTTGWLDEDDLVTLVEFHESVRSRYAARMSQLKALLTEVDSLELVIQDLRIDIQQQDLRTTLLSWVEPAPLAEDEAPGKTQISAPDPQSSTDTASEPGTISYVIRSGDSLRRIAEVHNTTIAEILALNPKITSSNQLYVGSTILLPDEDAKDAVPSTTAQVSVPDPHPVIDTASEPGTIPYVIRSGDSLRRIAEVHNTTIAEILALNPEITNPNQLFVGSTILLPDGDAKDAVPSTSIPVPQVPAVLPSTGETHRNMLARLPVRNRSHHGSYDRDAWVHWVDDDGDCESTRAEVLIAESRQTVTYRSNGCTVDTGLWVGPWGGRTLTQASEVDIDHHVPLYNTHISGGHAWSASQKRAYANDLALASALQATESGVNRAKGGEAPDEWKPPVQLSWCRYAQDWIEVKHKYSLLVTQAERAALSSMLDTCTGQPYVPPVQPVQPTPVQHARATPTPPVSVPQSQYPPPRRQGRYCNDFDTRAQYEAFYAGRKKPDSHDRDRDGHYCETLN